MKRRTKKVKLLIKPKSRLPRSPLKKTKLVRSLPEKRKSTTAMLERLLRTPVLPLKRQLLRRFVTRRRPLGLKTFVKMSVTSLTNVLSPFVST